MHEQLTKGLNKQQEQAVLYDGGPLLLLAGAGSGKTRVVTHRIARIIADGIHPQRIMALTFTNKAATEMKERLAKLLSQNVRGMWVGTFHSLFVRILRRHAEVLGYASDFRILDKSDQLAVLKQVAEGDKECDASTLKKMLGEISSAKNKGQTPDDLRGSFGVNKELPYYYEEYQKLLRVHNGMDFDDILLNAYNLLKDHPEIASLYQEQFVHILVDEYQDTNEVQYQIVAILAAKHRNICVVGDDDQSIYGFRGANIANILSFEKQFKDAKVIRLEQNYRSTGCILKAANSVITPNKERKGKKLWTDATFGSKIQLIRANDGLQEARWVADEIHRLTAEGPEGIAYDKVAILYRINALSRAFEQSLRRKGIPAQVYGGLRFYDRKEIRDVMAYLRLIEVHDDNMAFLRIVNTPRRQIGASTIESTMENARRSNISCFEVAKNATAYPDIPRLGATRLQQFAGFIEDMGTIINKNQMQLSEFIRSVQEKSGLKAEQENNRIKDPDARGRLENMGELLTDAAEFEVRCNEDLEMFQSDNGYGDYSQDDDRVPETLRDKLTAFVERSSLYTEEESGDNATPRVKMMTIHSAKGLEFDTVFVVGAEQGIFPSLRNDSLARDKDLEEERRLAYVAVTRAMRQLYISSVASRTLYAEPKNMVQSELFSDLPDDCVHEYELPRMSNSTGRCYVTNSGETNWQPTQTTKGTAGNSNFYSPWQSRPTTMPRTAVKAMERDGYNPLTATQKIIKSNVKPTKAAAEASIKANAIYKKGDTVIHKDLGEGTVVTVMNIHEDQLLKINFNGTERSYVSSNPHLRKG